MLASLGSLEFDPTIKPGGGAVYLGGGFTQQCAHTANKPFAQLVCCVGDGVSGPPAYDAAGGYRRG